MECQECIQPITNPLCPDCLTQATEQWLQDAAPEKIADVWHETNVTRRHEGVACVRCKNLFSTCTYCHTKRIFNILRDGNLQITYLKYFNFLT